MWSLAEVWSFTEHGKLEISNNTSKINLFLFLCLCNRSLFDKSRLNKQFLKLKYNINITFYFLHPKPERTPRAKAYATQPTLFRRRLTVYQYRYLILRNYLVKSATPQGRLESDDIRTYDHCLNSLIHD